MKKRNLPIVLLLTLVTLGIYALFWTYKTRQEILSQLADKKAIPSIFILLSPLFMALAFALLLLLQRASSNAIVLDVLFVLLGMSLVIASLVVPFWWFYKYFKALDQVTHADNFALLYCLWVIGAVFGFLPIWMMLAQNDLNKVIDRLAIAAASGAVPPADPLPPQNPLA